MSDVTGGIREALRKAPGQIRLGKATIGVGQPTYFIAEIGNNHNGDFFLARRSIEEAARAGAHAVKLQKRSIPDVFAKELRDQPLTKGEIKGDTYGEYREGLEFSLEDFRKLRDVAEANGVDFFATPFDLPSVDFLEKVGIPFYKIASFDLTNLPLLDRVARLKKPIILSTGMASWEEVDEGVATILAHHAEIILLHCVSVYPSPDPTINLNAMRALGTRYAPLPVGYSGHEPDILPSVLAVSQGATVIERHLTLSRRLPGPDHGTVSIEPPVFEEMVKMSARVQTILGKAEKGVLEQEKSARAKHAKSIVATKPIAKGASITAEMLTCKSPGYGLGPRELGEVVGRQAARDIESDAVLRREDVLWEPA